MTFGIDFPSLKGKDIEGEFEGNSIKLTDLTFGTEDFVFKSSIIQEHCLDKQRVREAIDKCEKSASKIMPAWFEEHSISKGLIDDLKKELGVK